MKSWSPSMAVFDRGASHPSPTATMSTSVATFGLFRCNDRDKRPPREVVTARLLGDPSPDRVVPDIPPERTWAPADAPRSPIYLTFRDYRAAQEGQV